MQTSKPVFTIFCFVLPLLLSACDQNADSDLQTYVADVQARKYAGIEPLPEVLNYASYVYDKNGMRDPFIPTNNTTDTRWVLGTPCAEVTRKRDALEDFSLEALAMVGSLEQDGERWALIRTQDGTVYRRKTLDYMGKDNGQIRNINERSIELLELISQGEGCIKKTTILTMNE
jgi:type IV pilus assembly protein PilP